MMPVITRKQTKRANSKAKNTINAKMFLKKWDKEHGKIPKKAHDDLSVHGQTKTV